MAEPDEPDVLAVDEAKAEAAIDEIDRQLRVLSEVITQTYEVRKGNGGT